MLSILDRFIEQVTQNSPLRVTRVLKFVQQPMVKFGIQPPVDQQTAAAHLSTQHRAIRVGPQQPLHIRKG